MENEPINDNPFFVTLSIEGSQLEEVEVEITDTMRTISEQIKRIVDAFELQKMDSNGKPITYHLGQKRDDSEEIIFQYQDEYGREQTLIDYKVKSGDRLFLISEPIAG